MERKGAKPQPEIVITEEALILPTDALVEKGRKVVAQVGDVVLEETTFTVDMTKAVTVPKLKGA